MSFQNGLKTDGMLLTAQSEKDAVSIQRKKKELVQSLNHFSNRTSKLDLKEMADLLLEELNQKNVHIID